MGGSLLDFGTVGQTSPQVTRLSLGTAAPFYHWDFRDWALEGHQLSSGGSAPLDPFQLPMFGLHDPNVETGKLGVFARYASEHAFWVTWQELELHNQHEVLLFLRDPQEQTASMRAALPWYSTLDVLLAQFPGDWQALWANNLNPGSATIWYPPARGWNGNDSQAIITTPVTVTPIIPTMFGVSTYQGPAAEPDGTGSVKAAKIVNHGLCGQEAAYFPTTNQDGILKQVLDEFPLQFAQTVLDANCHQGDVESLWTTISPWLDFTQEREDTQLGGFFFNLALNVKTTIFKAGPRLAPRSVHQWRLFDGRLTATGEMLSTSNSDGTRDFESMNELSAALTRQLDARPSPYDKGSTLAGAIFNVADGKQVYTGDVGITTCDISKSDAGSIAVPFAPTDECKLFWNDFTIKVGDAITAVGPALGINAAGRVQILETMAATEKKNNKDVSKNLRCVHRSANLTATEGTCEYVVRAKRLNVLPDAVELVFIDDAWEYSNPTYPIWLHLLDLELHGAPNAIHKLCDAAHGQSPGGTALRQFKNLQRGHREFTCSSCTAGCTLLEGP